MPPVELNTFPVSEVSRQTFSDLKLVDKAMEIPVVSDTVSELEKVKNTLRSAKLFYLGWLFISRKLLRFYLLLWNFCSVCGVGYEYLVNIDLIAQIDVLAYRLDRWNSFIIKIAIRVSKFNSSLR